MINQVTLVGRLTKDPELRLTQDSGIPVTHITLAVSRQFKNHSGQIEADFVQCTLWRKAAENTAQYCKKGSIVGVTGRIQSRHYDNNEGRRVYVTEVVAETVQFISKKSTGQDHAPIQSQAAHSSSSSAASQLAGAGTDAATDTGTSPVASQLAGVGAGGETVTGTSSVASQLAGAGTGGETVTGTSPVASQLAGAASGPAFETSPVAGTMTRAAQESSSSASQVTNLVSDSATVLTMSRASSTMASGAIARPTSSGSEQAQAGLI